MECEDGQDWRWVMLEHRRQPLQSIPRQKSWRACSAGAPMLMIAAGDAHAARIEADMIAGKTGISSGKPGISSGKPVNFSNIPVNSSLPSQMFTK